MSALRKVLVVDDDAVVGKSFNRVLSEKKGYIVTTAQNAHEALEQLRDQSFDMVFTDIKMPGMDGVELAERVKASQPWTPVVIITGYGTAENEARAKAAGVSEFVRKPLSPEMIEQSAACALREGTSYAAQMIEENAAYALRPSAADAAPEVALDSAAALQPEENRAKNVALFLAAPFIGLAYALMLPMVGLAMLAWTGWKALNASPAARKAFGAVKNVALLAAAPFIGLAYALALPLVGTAMLLWMAAKAIRAPKQVA
ncbi:MAG: response regulator [Rhodoferax sp.]